MARWTSADIPDQTGRTIVVTGANVGLGLESAKQLAARGAAVVLACRDPARGQAALGAVLSVATGPAPALVALDLADLESVESAALEIAARAPQIDVLMNNAGVMSIPKRALTPQGFEMQFGVNHLGHFALALRLMPQLLAARQGRVIALGSMAHVHGRIAFDNLHSQHKYDGWTAYSQSKLANVMFALELDRRAKIAGLPVIGVAAHPGLAATNLFAAGPKANGFNPAGSAVNAFIKIAGQSPRAGALGQLRAATDPEVLGGEYFGPMGFGGARGTPRHAPVSKRAMDDASSTRLWDESEVMVGLSLSDVLGTGSMARAAAPPRGRRAA